MAIKKLGNENHSHDCLPYNFRELTLQELLSKFYCEMKNQEINITNDVYNEINKINNSLELNIKSFGAIGNGVADDTVAFEKAFAFIKSMQNDKKYNRGVVLKIPNGVYIINKGFTLDFSIGIVGESMIKPPSYRLFGENAWQQEMRLNCSTIKYDTPKNNTTMFTVTDNTGYGVDVYFKDIMLSGNDGVVEMLEANSGQDDIRVNFTTVNSNGLDMSGTRFTRGSDNLFVTGFSGFGLRTHHWQQHNNTIATLCNIGIVTGGDGGLLSPYCAFCGHGIMIGDGLNSGATDRIIDARIEWCFAYGILIYNGGSNRISGFIDRCSLSGYCQPNDTWNMNVDLTIQRCGAKHRGKTISDLNTKELKQEGSNAYINNARGGNYRFTHIKSSISDTGDPLKAPVIASCIIGGIDFVSIDSVQGFENNLNTDYFLEGNSNYTLICNGNISSSIGFKQELNGLMTIDMFGQHRFRPPMKWGLPSEGYATGDVIFNSQAQKLCYKTDSGWKEL